MSSSNSTRSWCKSWDCWCREPPPRLGTTLVIRGVAPAEHRGQGPTFWLAECLPQQRERVWLTKTFEVFAAQATPAAFQKVEKETQTDELPAAFMMDQGAQTALLPAAKAPGQARMSASEMDPPPGLSRSVPEGFEAGPVSTAVPRFGERMTSTSSSSSRLAPDPPPPQQADVEETLELMD